MRSIYNSSNILFHPYRCKVNNLLFSDITACLRYEVLCTNIFIKYHTNPLHNCQTSLMKIFIALVTCLASKIVYQIIFIFNHLKLGFIVWNVMHSDKKLIVLCINIIV